MGIAVIVATIVANLWAAGADLVRAKQVLANADHVGVPLSWLPWLAAPKAAGAIGLLLGLLGVQPIGIAAAVGLVLFFLAAVGAHVRASAYRTIGFPISFLVLAVGSLVVATTS
jgi:hypothetical protein